MSYEILVLPVPPGAEIEEAGEALEVRLAGGHVAADPAPAARARRRALAAAICAADPALRERTADDAGVGIVLADGRGMIADLTETHVAFRVSYSHADEDAEALFERLFDIVGAAVRETGWRVYDPQGACAVDVDDDGRDATLEIYQSVVDQLLPESRWSPG